MKRMACFLSILGLCLSLTFQVKAETIKYYCDIDTENQGYQSFIIAHPDITLEPSGTFFATTNEFINALLVKEFNSDLFSINTNLFNCQELMKKGYCVDLSGSEVIRDAVSRMHPRIAEQAMMDGKVYGVPCDISFYYLQIDEDGWAEAGFTEEDIPDSFPAFLDFLERWCDDVEASQEGNIRLMLSWDTSLYNEYSYTAWLTELLIDSYITQTQFANKSLRFDDQELFKLLERCRDVGARIYDTEPKISASGAQFGQDYQLFENGLQMAWPQKASHILCFRLNDEQPKLIKASLQMQAVNPGSDIPDLCIELLEKLVTGPESSISWTNSLLYQNAEPVIDPSYEDSVEHWTTRVATFEKQLESDELTFDEKLEIESQLERSKYYLEYELSDQGKYYMSPAQLADYNTYVDTLYFPAPSIFQTTWDTFAEISNLEKQYAGGILSAEQFLSELDHRAYMIEME